MDVRELPVCPWNFKTSKTLNKIIRVNAARFLAWVEWLTDLESHRHAHADTRARAAHRISNGEVQDGHAAQLSSIKSASISTSSPRAWHRSLNRKGCRGAIAAFIGALRRPATAAPIFPPQRRIFAQRPRGGEPVYRVATLRMPAQTSRMLGTRVRLGRDTIGVEPCKSKKGW